jgi:molybdopterin-guanine dinucleotide biosynthesis adapter protein
MRSTEPELLGFAAYSGVGKTTLLSAIIPLLRQSGYRVAVIKYSHHDFEIDYTGKDSYRLRQAGANPTLIVSPYRQVRITEYPAPQSVDLSQQIAALADSAPDLILVEGFREQALPKIELHRPSLNKPLLFASDPYIIAVASDDDSLNCGELPLLDLNNPRQIADFIIHRILESPA